jgi:hypothetical protein
MTLMNRGDAGSHGGAAAQSGLEYEQVPLLVLGAPWRRLPVPWQIARQRFRFAEEELRSTSTAF